MLSYPEATMQSDCCNVRIDHTPKPKRQTSIIVNHQYPEPKRQTSIIVNHQYPEPKRQIIDDASQSTTNA